MIDARMRVRVRVHFTIPIVNADIDLYAMNILQDDISQNVTLLNTSVLPSSA